VAEPPEPRIDALHGHEVECPRRHWAP
jgi:hypothetical protein